MLVNISAQFPKEIEAAANADMAATFRRSLENTLRGRMNTLVERIKHDAHYQAIAQDYAVEQKTAEGQVGFAVVNTNIHSRFLIGGSRPHIIPRAFGRPGSVRHPGISPDQPVLRDIAGAEQSLVDAATDAIDKWADKLGAEVVA